VPKQHRVGVRIEGGLPSGLSLVFTVSKTEAYTVASYPTDVYRSAHEMDCVVDACTNSLERNVGSPAVVSVSADRKSILLSLPQSEYRVEVKGMPSNFELKSFRSGSRDLLSDPLVVGSTAPEDIIIAVEPR
jgi:hypothetical protein